MNKLLFSCIVAFLVVALVNADTKPQSLNDALDAVKNGAEAAFGGFKDAAEFAKNFVDPEEDEMADKYASWPNYNDPKTRYHQSLAAQVALDVVYRDDAQKFNPTKEAGWNEGWKNDVFVTRGLLRLVVLHNEKDKTAIIAIAGTRLEADDWAGLARVDYTDLSEVAFWKNLPGSVHTGMYKKLQNAWDVQAFQDLMAKLIKGEFTIVIAGHSQGGGHAGILAGQLHYFAKNHVKQPEPYYIQVLTFGSVRTGSEDFAKYVSENVKYITRVRHKMDAASGYPPPGAFFHTGKRMLFSCLHTPLHCHDSKLYLSNFRNKMGTSSIVSGKPVRDNCKGTCWTGPESQVIN